MNTLQPTPTSRQWQSAGEPWQHPAGCPGTWNLRHLQAFTLLMAGRGVCVNETMMLCDPTYARARLRHACTFPDPQLQQMAVDMLAAMGGEGRADTALQGAMTH